jgi:hypothetical protein
MQPDVKTNKSRLLRRKSPPRSDFFLCAEKRWVDQRFLNPSQEAYTAQALRDGGFVIGGDASGAQTGRMSAARWTASYEQLKSLNILDGPLDPSTTFDLKFAQE